MNPNYFDLKNDVLCIKTIEHDSESQEDLLYVIEVKKGFTQIRVLEKAKSNKILKVLEKTDKLMDMHRLSL